MAVMNRLFLTMLAVLHLPQLSEAQVIERDLPDCALLQAAREGAAQGIVRDVYLMARFYSTGSCVSGDGEKAVLLYQRAARQSYPRAFYNLGIISASHDDFSSAEAWFKKGAELGHRGCELQLGILYSLVPPPVGDLVKGLAWLSLTASRNEPVASEAEDVRHGVRKRVDGAILKSAARMSVRLRERYGDIPEFRE